MTADCMSRTCAWNFVASMRSLDSSDTWLAYQSRQDRSKSCVIFYTALCCNKYAGISHSQSSALCHKYKAIKKSMASVVVCVVVVCVVVVCAVVVCVVVSNVAKR